MKRIVRAAPLALLLACTNGSSSAPLTTSSEPRSLDASACTSGGPRPHLLHCRATDPHALRVGFAVCGQLVAHEALTFERRKTRAALVVDGDLRTSAALAAAGDVIVGGMVDGPSTQTIEFDLRAGGGWTTDAPVLVAGSAYVGRSLDVRTTATVRGTLHAPPGSDVTNVVADRVVYEDVVVPAPVQCATTPDVEALARAASVDASVVRLLPRTALADVSEPTDLTVGCGTYRLNTIDVESTLALHVVGPTVIVVDGDLRVRAPLSVTFEGNDASLDLVVTGSLLAESKLTVGASSTVARTMLAVGKAIHVAAPTTIHGSIVAPKAPTVVDDRLDVWGAALLGSTLVDAPIVVHDGPTLAQDGCRLDD
jgi:hypothetical protein